MLLIWTLFACHMKHAGHNVTVAKASWYVVMTGWWTVQNPHAACLAAECRSGLELDMSKL